MVRQCARAQGPHTRRAIHPHANPTNRMQPRANARRHKVAARRPPSLRCTCTALIRTRKCLSPCRTRQSPRTPPPTARTPLRRAGLRWLPCHVTQAVRRAMTHSYSRAPVRPPLPPSIPCPHTSPTHPPAQPSARPPQRLSLTRPPLNLSLTRPPQHELLLVVDVPLPRPQQVDGGGAGQDVEQPRHSQREQTQKLR